MRGAGAGDPFAGRTQEYAEYECCPIPVGMLPGALRKRRLGETGSHMRLCK